MNIFDKLLKKDSRISVIGLGYVGLPLALEFARKVPVVGFDINHQRVEMMKRREDPSRELEPSAFDGCDILFTSNADDLKKAHFHVIGVPTPIDHANMPDLKPVISASQMVGRALKKGDYVVYESTVYPGATEEECIPVLEQESGLTFGKDFKVGFSPERINPGDKVNTLTNTMKIVSGSDAEALENIAKTYELVIKAGVHRAPSIKVAEAGKIIENTQRDVNIALMNELSVMFNRMGINTYDVLEAAGTKWNFLKFFPGLVGGHCIGVDPYYLTYKAKMLNYHPQIIDSGRYVNDAMGRYVARELVKTLISEDINILRSKVLVMGITFKENVTDIRNSKVADVIHELENYGVNVDTTDQWACPEEVKHEYGIDLIREPENNYDAVVLAVAHNEYTQLTEDDFLKMCGGKGVLVDVKGLYRNKIKKMTYWSL